jgi:hypothetical protein
LPIAPPPVTPWKDPDWKDPEKKLADVSYDRLPLAEVARHLREYFKDAFDVLISGSWWNPSNPAETIYAAETPITMQLKNVSASEVFNAMNLVFETENTPLRWELKLNGKRPTVILRVTQAPMPVQHSPSEAPKRMITFVGDLIGEEKSGGMTMEQLVKTASEVYRMTYGSPGGVLQFHKEAQLLIVTGTVDQTQFVQQTLSALRQKVQLERRSQPRAAESKANADEPKSP